MNDPFDAPSELGHQLDADEIDAIDRIADRLNRERPRPTAHFRSQLRARLTEPSASAGGWRPQRLGFTVAAYLASGFLLLGVAALGLADAGPLAF